MEVTTVSTEYYVNDPKETLNNSDMERASLFSVGRTEQSMWLFVSSISSRINYCSSEQ